MINLIYFLMLPKELWSIILSKCYVYDWPNIVLTCKMFNNIIHDPFFQDRWYPMSDDGELVPIHFMKTFRKAIIVVFNKDRFFWDNKRYRISSMSYAYGFDPTNNFRIWPMQIIIARQLWGIKGLPPYLITGKYLYSDEICKLICARLRHVRSIT